MKKLFLLSLLVAPVALFAAVTETVLFENNFDSYTPGNFYGQDADFEVMHSDVYCQGEGPADGEITIVNDANRGNVLHLIKIKTPDGVASPAYDRGLRIPLNWGSVDYNNGECGTIVLTGKVKIPEGNGYAELRLTSSSDVAMLRWCPHSSDYKTYVYNFNDGSAISSSCTNANDPLFQEKSSRTQYATADAVIYDTWCDFTVIVDCEVGTIKEYTITDGGSFSFTGRNVSIMPHALLQPYYFEFLAVGNGHDTNRNGAYFDNVKVSFYQESQQPQWVTVFEDDFSSYHEGESLTAVNPVYKRVGNDATFTDLIIESNGYNCVKLWLNMPSGYPRDGVYVDIPSYCAPVPGGKLRATAVFIVPDNGVWLGMGKGDTILTTLGYHSANIWFANWENGDLEPRYSGRARNISGKSYWVTAKETIAWDDSTVPQLESTYIGTSQSAYTDYQWSLRWNDYYDTTMADSPNRVFIRLMGWNNSAVRWTKLRYLKIEYAAPEPGMIALLALFGLSFLRRK